MLVPDLEIPELIQLEHKGNLVAKMELKGYMPDHLDFVAHFSLLAAQKLKIPTELIHLEPTVKKYWVNKGPFVHAKTKEIFESVEHTRAIQAYDAHLDTIEQWKDYVNASLPAGIKLHLTKWEWVDFEFGEKSKKKTYRDLILEYVKMYEDHFKDSSNPKPRLDENRKKLSELQ